LQYSVVESAGKVTVTLEKKLPEDVSVFVRTVEDTAKEIEDYQPKFELITLKAHEQKRDVEIEIVDDCQYEPDKDFKIELLDENTKERLTGDDTVCTVTILDEDRPGIIGFKERFMTVRRKDEVAYVHLERTDGADGDISCVINTVNKHEALGDKEAAVEGADFEVIKERKIDFKHNVTENRIEVILPDCETREGEEDKIVSFAICISEPKPDGVRLSKKNLCFIDIVPNDDRSAAQE